MFTSKEPHKTKMLYNRFCQMMRFNPSGKKNQKENQVSNTKAHPDHEVLCLIPSERSWCYKCRNCVWDYHSTTLKRLFLLFCYIFLKKKLMCETNNYYLKRPLFIAFLCYSNAYSWLKSTLYKDFLCNCACTC